MFLYSHRNSPLGYYLGTLPDGRVMLGRHGSRCGKFWEAWGSVSASDVATVYEPIFLKDVFEGMDRYKSLGRHIGEEFYEQLKEWTRTNLPERYELYYNR